VESLHGNAVYAAKASKLKAVSYRDRQTSIQIRLFQSADG
jgi:hypothetical protein